MTHNFREEGVHCKCEFKCFKDNTEKKNLKNLLNVVKMDVCCNHFNYDILILI